MAKTFIAIILILIASATTSTIQAAGPKRLLLWVELSSEQQQFLSPLSSGWDEMELSRKKKWLGIAKRYPTMKPAEQKNVRKRMQEWASLTPQQRQSARDRFRKLEKLPPDKRQSLTEKWEEYQQLPETERARLRAMEENRKASSANVPKSQPSTSHTPPELRPLAR